MNQNEKLIKIFDNCAQQYQDRFMQYHLYDGTYDVFCDQLEKKGAHVLEIGCGPGNITRYLLNKRPDLKIFGIDLSPKMIELAKINNPEAQFQVMDCRAIAQLNKKYDAIICGFCLPYLSKEESLKLIQEAAFLLRAGGVLYISAIEDDYQLSGFQGSSSGEGEKLYIYYHEAKYLKQALADNGLQLVDLQRIEYPVADADGFFAYHICIIAVKNINDYHD